MIYLTIGLFALAAILGMILLSFVLQGKETPKAVVLTHGPIAAIGLILLIVYSLGEGPGPWESVVLFVIAAMGGIFMVIRDYKGLKIPKSLAILHGLLAVTGFILLLIHAF